MASKSRSASYTNEEDKHLCHVYLDVSQNPIIGIYQSKIQFWTRIEEQYNTSKTSIMQQRNKRSLQCRMQAILHDVAKLRGCIRQIENLHPSGASDQDILIRAKELLTQDKTCKKGFKFDHVWPLLKDMEKFADNVNPTTTNYQRSVHNLDSSQSDTPTQSPTAASPGLSAFSLNLSDENIGATSSERPLGVKKSKLKKKKDETYLERIDTIKGEQKELMDILKQGSVDRQQNYELQVLRLQHEEKRFALAELREENKILLVDLNTIKDPILREYYQNEQTRILRKRAEKEHKGDDNDFATYYGNIGGGSGSGSDLPDY